MEQNNRNTEKSDGCLGRITSHPVGKRANPKSASDIKELVLGGSDCMPDHIEKEMTRIMKDFIWDGNQRVLMRLDYTAKVRETGGLGMPDLKTRMKAINIM